MSQNTKKRQYFKIVLLGDSGVGKTALIQRFVNDHWQQQFKPTVGVDFHHKTVTIDGGKELVLQIWDTAGQERFQSLSYSYYRGADCCGLVYDVTNPETFEKISQWKEMFLKNLDPNEPQTFPFVLIGNKSDNV